MTATEFKIGNKQTLKNYFERFRFVTMVLKYLSRQCKIISESPMEAQLGIPSLPLF